MARANSSQPSRHRQRRLATALDADREHAAEAAGHLALGHGVAGIVAEAGIEHLRHTGVAEAMLGDGLGAAAGLADAQHEGAQAAQQEPGLEAAEDGAVGPAQADDALPEGVVAGGDEGARRARRCGR